MTISDVASNLSILAASEGGGAGLDQVIGLSAVAAVVGAVLLCIGYMHRAKRITWLGSLADAFGRRFHRPAWVALPLAIFISSIICALFGFIWDVSLHIGNGRDPGPLANPAHYFILIGLFGMFVGGMTAVVLPYDKPGPAAVRITRNWYAPVGGILMASCGLYALIGFPLDDVWHRVFGQDVTLWGPTHLMLIGGAGFSTLCALYLEHEGRLATGPDTQHDGIALKATQYLGFSGLVIGMSVFQIEYDFGVSQFRLVFQPMLIAAAATFGLVAARMMLGRGAALVAAIIAIALRGGVALIVGPILGAPISWFPLYLGPAIVVELIGLTALVKRPVVFGAVSGLGVATVGIGLESLWIGVVYHYPWPVSMWPEALAMAVPVAVLIGACSAMVGMVFTGQKLPHRAISIGVVIATLLVTGGAVANGLRTVIPPDATATIKVTEAPSANGQAMVNVEIERTNPLNLISADPEWVTILAWQGKLANDRGLVLDNLRRVGTGHYVSTRPIPVSGSWKTVLRLQDGRTMAGIPIFLAADPAIGKKAEGIAAKPNLKAVFGAPHFEAEINILQRERNFDVPGWIWTAGCLVVLACTLALIAGLAWGAGRINNSETAQPAEADDRPRVPA